MRLVDLRPSFFCIMRDPSRHGVGLAFDCPCRCGDRCAIYFTNPLDGGAVIPIAESGNQKHRWQRTGETFDTLTLTPSINWLERENGPSHWHGFITNGEVRNA
jgi:Family of unknown function (DUF6527)